MHFYGQKWELWKLKKLGTSQTFFKRCRIKGIDPLTFVKSCRQQLGRQGLLNLCPIYNLYGQYQIDHKVGLTIKIFGQFFWHFALVIKWRVVWQRGKCGRFVIIYNDILEVNPPYGQSYFMVNLGPTTSLIFLGIISIMLLSTISIMM